MAVRARLELRSAAGKRVETVAILNGGFEMPVPHLLLPTRCAARLFADLDAISAVQEFEAAGGRVRMAVLTESVRGRVIAGKRKGKDVEFQVLVSEHDREALVSDAGIDALGVRVLSFAPARWSLGGERKARASEAPQLW